MSTLLPWIKVTLACQSYPWFESNHVLRYAFFIFNVLDYHCESQFITSGLNRVSVMPNFRSVSQTAWKQLRENHLGVASTPPGSQELIFNFYFVIFIYVILPFLVLLSPLCSGLDSHRPTWSATTMRCVRPALRLAALRLAPPLRPVAAAAGQRRHKSDDISRLFVPVPIQPSQSDDISSVGSELAGKLVKPAVLRILNKFYQRPKVRRVSLENGLDSECHRTASCCRLISLSLAYLGNVFLSMAVEYAASLPRRLALLVCLVQSIKIRFVCTSSAPYACQTGLLESPSFVHAMRIIVASWASIWYWVC